MPSPYAGNPASYPASVNVLAGTDLPNTANFNTAYEGTLDRTAFLYGGREHPGSNWFPQWRADQAMTSAAAYPYNGPFAQGSAMLATSWDPNNNRWLALIADATNSPPSLSVWEGYGMDAGGHDWTIYPATLSQFGDTNPSAGACCADPATAGVFWCAAISETAGALQVFRYGGGWVVEDTIADTWSAAYSVEMIPFTDASGNKRLIYIYVSTAAGKGAVRSALASAPNTWTTVLTPTFSSTAYWLLKSGGPSGSPLVVLMQNLGGGGYWTSPDGVTFTSRTMPWTNAPGGLVWSPAHQLWFVLVQTSGTTTEVWSSADGISWTNVGAGPANVTVMDLAVICNSLVAIFAEGSALGTGHGSAMMLSVDGGVTWKPTQATLYTNNAYGSSAYGSAAYVRPRFAASGNALAAYNALCVRFSHVAG